MRVMPTPLLFFNKTKSRKVWASFGPNTVSQTVYYGTGMLSNNQQSPNITIPSTKISSVEANNTTLQSNRQRSRVPRHFILFLLRPNTNYQGRFFVCLVSSRLHRKIISILRPTFCSTGETIVQGVSCLYIVVGALRGSSSILWAVHAHHASHPFIHSQALSKNGFRMVNSIFLVHMQQWKRYRTFTYAPRCFGAVDGRGGTVRKFSIGLVYSFFLGARQRNPKDPRTALGTLDFVSGLASRSLVTSLNYQANNRAVALTQRTPKHVANLSFFPNFVSQFGTSTQELRLTSQIGNIINSVSTLPFHTKRLSLV